MTKAVLAGLLGVILGVLVVALITKHMWNWGFSDLYTINYKQAIIISLLLYRPKSD